MKNWTPYLIALAVVAYLVFDMASTEYAKIRNAIGETRNKANEVADETKQTIESIRKTIDELRSKFALLESQMAKQTEQKPVDDVAEVTSEAKVVMHSASWCGPCRTWKRDYLPQWRAQGWQVDVVENDATTRSVPWFEIYYRGKRYEAIGLLDKSLFEKVTQDGK
jgi:hypothetical protein